MLGIFLTTSCSEDKDYTLGADESRLLNDITFRVSDVLPLAVGMDSTLVYSVSPATADDQTVVFQSSDESIATVSQDGTIHGVAVGEATISATPPIGFGATASVLVKVIPEVIKAQQINIRNTTPLGEDGVIYVTDNLQLQAEILPENHTYDFLTWASSDEAVAAVDSTGLVTCLKEGEATIYALSNDHSGVKGEYHLVVKPYIAVESLQIEPLQENICLTRGAVDLSVAYTPGNGTLGSVTWASSDEGVATVSRGKVTPQGFGTATITATCQATGFVASVNVTVDPGWVIYDNKNQWQPWVCADQKAADERLANVWRIHFPDAGSGKWRRDIKMVCSKDKPYCLQVKNYPVIAIRTNKQTGGNSTLDAVETSLGSAGNINPKDGILLSDGTRLLVYNLGKKYANADVVRFSVFQFKMADIPNANVSKSKQYYDIYWIRTFKSEAEASAFAENEIKNGH